MKMTSASRVLLAASAALLVLLSVALGQTSVNGPYIDPKLTQDFVRAASLPSALSNEAAAPGSSNTLDAAGPVSFLVHLRSSDEHSAIASGDHLSWEQRGHAVFAQAQKRAAATQPQILSLLEGHPDVVSVRRYTVANALVVVARYSALERLVTAVPHLISGVHSNRAFVVPKPVVPDVSTPIAMVSTAAFDNDDDEQPKESEIQWGVEHIGSPQVWQQGFDGTGLVYANSDTGVDFEHQILRNTYRGLNAQGEYDHDYSWYDGVREEIKPLSPEAAAKAGPRGEVICPFKGEKPCDDSGHGTHTTGTAVGAQGYGVAPGARWIACRNMDRGLGCPQSYLNCLEFMMAPTRLNGSDPRPDLRPHVMSNSYGCPDEEGCAMDVMREAVANLVKSGVFMAVSAGNEGPSCETVGAPPAVYTESFVVAASTPEQGLASFSSRGPVNYVEAGKTSVHASPDIAAPGVKVTSSIPGGKFDTYQGTSMASPHVAGAALLTMHACPQLQRRTGELRGLFEKTATPRPSSVVGETCGDDTADSVPNNLFGYGIINVAKAVEQCIAAAEAESAPIALPNYIPVVDQ